MAGFSGIMTDNSAPQSSNEATAPVKKRRVEHQAATACTNCSRLKARCEVNPGSMLCRRCLSSGTECIWRPSMRGRWSRNRPIKDNMNEPREGNDSSYGSTEAGTVGSPMEDEADDLPAPHFETPAEEPKDFGGAIHFKVDSSLYPMGLLAESSLNMIQDEKGRGSPPGSGSLGTSHTDSGVSPRTGPAAPAYFQQGLNTQFRPKHSKNAGPQILKNEMITENEAAILFDLYFAKCNPLINLIDKSLCSMKSCATRSPFLFTAICAVAARYYKGGALYPPLMRHARSAGLQAMLEAKNTYTVQAFIILAYWGPPTTAYELDNSFLFAGIAIRLGQEIGLHHKNYIVSYPDRMPVKLRQNYQAEMLNRERTWFCCFIIDRSSCALSGKPDTLFEKFLIRSSSSWCDQPGTSVADVFLCGVVEIQRIVWRILDVIYSSSQTKSAISPTVNYYIITEDLTQRLDDWQTAWDRRLAERHSQTPHEHTSEYRAMLRMYMNFYKLIPLSIGLQNCLDAEQLEMDAIMFCEPCYKGATEVINIGLRELGCKTWMKYATDHWTVVLAYCACFLLKLLNSPYKHMFQRDTILGTVEDTARGLEEAAEDEEHAPFVYGAFIRKRLAYECTPTIDRSAHPPTLAPNRTEQLNIVGPAMMGPYGMPSAPEIVQPPIGGSDSDHLNAAQLDSLLGSDWLDSFLSQQNQTNTMDMNPNTAIDFSRFEFDTDLSQILN